MSFQSQMPPTEGDVFLQLQLLNYIALNVHHITKQKTASYSLCIAGKPRNIRKTADYLYYIFILIKANK